MPNIPVLANAEALTAAWLSASLGADVSDFRCEEILGEGYASRMYRVSLTHGASNQVPNSVILKLATTNPNQLELLHGDNMYREALFYAMVSNEVSEIIPEIYFSDFDSHQKQLTILMEDLGEISRQSFHSSLTTTLAATKALGRIHAHYWQSDEVNTEKFAPLQSQLSNEETVELISTNIEIEERAPYSFEYLSACMKKILKLAALMPSSNDKPQNPFTLIHGDFHARNVHCTDSRAIIFDWQAAERGNPARDLAYWLLTSVDTADRKEFSARMIDCYLHELADFGIQTYTKKLLMRDFQKAVNEMIPRIYCYQSLLDTSNDDEGTLELFLRRAQALAKDRHYLGGLTIASLFARIAAPFLK